MFINVNQLIKQIFIIIVTLVKIILDKVIVTIISNLNCEQLLLVT